MRWLLFVCVMLLCAVPFVARATDPCGSIPPPVNGVVYPAPCFGQGTLYYYRAFGFQSAEMVKITTHYRGVTTVMISNAYPSGRVEVGPVPSDNLGTGLWERDIDGLFSGHHASVAFMVLSADQATPMPFITPTPIGDQASPTPRPTTTPMPSPVQPTSTVVPTARPDVPGVVLLPLVRNDATP